MTTWKGHKMSESKKLFVKAGGVGAGVVLAVAVVVAIGNGWLHRPKEWSNTASTAKYTELTTVRIGEGFRITIQSALTNNTKEAYSIPSHSS